jgi:hypothetical protein
LYSASYVAITPWPALRAQHIKDAVIGMLPPATGVYNLSDKTLKAAEQADGARVTSNSAGAFYRQGVKTAELIFSSGQGSGVSRCAGLRVRAPVVLADKSAPAGTLVFTSAAGAVYELRCYETIMGEVAAQYPVGGPGELTWDSPAARQAHCVGSVEGFKGRPSAVVALARLRVGPAAAFIGGVATLAERREAHQWVLANHPGTGTWTCEQGHYSRTWRGPHGWPERWWRAE